ncbi:hypothetical protein HD554DRAFT_2325623 [Boletus coccyginus]|nr:hypothetical protein HD554DRAFT_2325623 [Boletus coccyginus]
MKELEDFHRTIHSESDTLPKRRKQSHSGGRGTGGTRLSRKSKNVSRGRALQSDPRNQIDLQPFVLPRSEPSSSLSTVTASLGTISRTCMDYALHFERIAEKTMFPSCVGTSPPEALAQATKPDGAPPNLPERKRLCPPIEPAEAVALFGLVDTLVRDLRAFASHLDVFNTVFAELARAQDIFVVYLKDGQSVGNQQSEKMMNVPRTCTPGTFVSDDVGWTHDGYVTRL